MTEKNAERVERQRRTPITVVIGNPPYNMDQQNENDNNKNRKYEVIDERVGGNICKRLQGHAAKPRCLTPTSSSSAGPRTACKGGTASFAFVSNNSFVDQHAFDGMQEALVGGFHGHLPRRPARECAQESQIERNDSQRVWHTRFGRRDNCRGRRETDVCEYIELHYYPRSGELARRSRT